MEMKDEEKTQDLFIKEISELRQQLADEKAIMVEISRIIGSTLKIEEVYERFAQEAKKLISFDRIAVNTIHAQDRTSPTLMSPDSMFRSVELGRWFPSRGAARRRSCARDPYSPFRDPTWKMEFVNFQAYCRVIGRDFAPWFWFLLSPKTR
jgi:hypothetical protein